MRGRAAPLAYFMSYLRNYVWSLIAILIGWGPLVLPSALAEETVINNQISVSARSGGQAAAGRTRVRASVKTIVNGETVTDWQEERMATSSQAVKIEKTFVNQIPAKKMAPSISSATSTRQFWLREWWRSIQRLMAAFNKQP